MNALRPESVSQQPPLVGTAQCFRELVGRLARVADAQRTTLLTGPTGSGKDVIARSLHAQSPRRSRAFVAVHCAALPDSLVEAEMFGHCRGAFTGATQTRGGLVRSASNGTLFLDEIDSLPGSAQAKLLRFLETGEYRSIGSDQVEHSDAWVIAATNTNLAERVRVGAFRADLMFRLAVVKLPVPALRERWEDIRPLAQHFLQQVDATKQFNAEALRALESYDWPGNVRELKHRVESAALFSSESIIDPRALSFDHPRDAPSVPDEMSLDGSTEKAPSSERLEGQLWNLVNGSGLTLSQAIGKCERLLVRAALRAERDNRTRAANRLGIHVRTIFKKLRSE